MRPSARLASAIELIELIEAEIAKTGAPMDRIIQNYFRARRYAGSKDRRAVSNMVYSVYRKRELLLWSLNQIECTAINARSLFTAWMVGEGEVFDDFGEDNQFAPVALSDEENHQIEALKRLDVSTAPQMVTANVPAYSERYFIDRFGDNAVSEANALNAKAPFTIRVNPYKAGSSDLLADIKKVSEHFENTKLSPFGFSTSDTLNISQQTVYKSGDIEIQDEAAQIASILVDAKPKQTIVDLCAGAGGKSLMLGAFMENKGQVHAFDVSKRRLDELKRRSQRAGLHNIQVKNITLEPEGRIEQLKELSGKADRVVLDVPCSGSGTWRRSPDLRWRFDEDAHDQINVAQKKLIEEGAALLRVGGRMIYMTCSIYASENEAIVEGFLNRHGDNWRSLGFKDIWADSVLQGKAPKTLSHNPEFLQLSPYTHSTDGFFIAVLERFA
jgi:16S rRNA (cytosine967-C5)-methyltransferase